MKKLIETISETDNQLLSLMTHVQSFLKGRLTLGELGEAEERAEIFRTNQIQVTHYDEVAERVNSAQLERELNECKKDKARLDWLEKSNYELYEPNTDSLFAQSSREAIDEAMEANR